MRRPRVPAVALYAHTIFVQLMLVNVLNCLYDAISIILRKQVEKKALLDQLDVCLLAVDELCDSGIVMECDPQAVVR